MLDIQIQRKNLETMSPEEISNYYDIATRDVSNYVYGGKNAPKHEFKFDAMSIRSWVHALKCIDTPVGVVRTLYLASVESLKAQKDIVRKVGKTSYDWINKAREKGETYGLRTDVGFCAKFHSDPTSKGVKRDMIKKNIVDFDTSLVMMQYFSPHQDIAFHLTEIPKGVYGKVVVENSEIVSSTHPDLFDEVVNDIIKGFDGHSIVPHHPQYVEHARTGLNFELHLVEREGSHQIDVFHATALLNKNFDPE